MDNNQNNIPKKESPLRTVLKFILALIIVLGTVAGLLIGSIFLLMKAKPYEREYTSEEASYLAMQQSEAIRIGERNEGR
jgi:cytosine/uracil/thiamine/allantoin permease